MDVEIGPEAALFPEKEYINGIAVAVHGFLMDLRFLHKQLKVGGGLALFTKSFCLPLVVTLFFLLLHFIYIEIHLTLIETIIRDALKGGNPGSLFINSIM